MEPSGPATSTNVGGVRSTDLSERFLRFWKYLRSGSRTRKRTLDSLSDHVLADIGLDGPGYEQPTWERYIHR